MGYFSNGSEGMDYEEQFCRKCVHDDRETGCPVINLHMLWNYESCRDKAKRDVLNSFIPMKDGLWNEQCKMFAERQRGLTV